MKINLIAVLTALLALGYSNKSNAQYKPSSIIISGHSKVSDRDVKGTRIRPTVKGNPYQTNCKVIGA